VRLDPAFVRRRIVTRPVPVLGTVTCHRKMLPALEAAMRELDRRGLARLVDPAEYAGCYAPRRIRPGGALSLHAWGLAVDLNASANPFGGRSRQDRRLVRIMERHGFTWGGDFPPTSDPMHFEFRGRPGDAAGP
jgi:D-alanyl-D-alanine carboxypeptidase